MSNPSDPAPERPKPRQIPPSARKAQDTNEQDLWDFDDPATPSQGATPPVGRGANPAPMGLPKGNADAAARKRVQRTVSPATPYESKKKSQDDIGELDEWDKNAPPARPGPEPAPAPRLEPAPTAVAAGPAEFEATPAPETQAEPTDETAISPADATAPEEGERVRVHLPKPLSGLSKLEKICLCSLGAILLVTAVTLMVIARSRLPLQEDLQAVKFPVKGEKITITEVESYWREPVSGKDTVRKDTKLIPVAHLKLEGGPCVIRAFFTDEHGEKVGDSITRSVSTGDVELTATAGLEDTAIHASFRLGETKSWRLEVLEGPSADAPLQDFKRVFELPISNERR